MSKVVSNLHAAKMKDVTDKTWTHQFYWLDWEYQPVKGMYVYNI